MAASGLYDFQSNPGPIREHLGQLGCSRLEVEAFFRIAELDLNPESDPKERSNGRIASVVQGRQGLKELTRHQFGSHLHKLQKRGLIHRPRRKEGQQRQRFGWGYWHLTPTGNRLAVSGVETEPHAPMPPAVKIQPRRPRRAVFLVLGLALAVAGGVWWSAGTGGDALVVETANIDGRLDFPVLCSLYDEEYNPLRREVDSGSDGACRWSRLEPGKYRVEVHKSDRVDHLAVEPEFWGTSLFRAPGEHVFQRNVPFGYLNFSSPDPGDLWNVSLVVENPSWANAEWTVRVHCIWDDDDRQPYLYDAFLEEQNASIGDRLAFMCQHPYPEPGGDADRFGYVVQSMYGRWLTTDSWWTNLSP